jgi:hypothetical protein
MKKYIELIFISIAIIVFASCKNDDAVRHSIPAIASASFASQTVTYGDSILFNASVNDAVTPLSTLKVQLIIGDSIVNTTVIRTKGNSTTVSKKLYVPFYKNAIDNTQLKANLLLTNVDGNTTSQTITTVTAKRPVFQSLKLIMGSDTIPMTPDGTVANQYDAVWTGSNNVQIMVASSDLKYTWANVDGTLGLGSLLNGSVTLNDPTLIASQKIIFNTKTFAFDFVGQRVFYYVNNNLLTPSSTGTLDASVTFTNGQAVNFTGTFNGVDASTIVSRDYFTKTGNNTFTFAGPSGTYTLHYALSSQFIYVDIPGQVKPNCYWVCGTGLGNPNSTSPTSNWGFSWDSDQKTFQDYYVPKISSGVYKITLYVDKTANFKFFGDTGWGGEIDAGTGKDLTGSNNPNVDFTQSDGNIHLTSGFVSGTYTITVDLNNKMINFDPAN